MAGRGAGDSCCGRACRGERSAKGWLMCWPGRPCSRLLSGFFCSGIPQAHMAPHLPGRMLLGRAPGAGACLGGRAALSFALFAFARAFLTLPVPASLLLLAARACPARPRRRGHIRPSPASRRHSKTLTLACSPPRGPRDTDVQFAHLEYRSSRSDACRAASCHGKHAACVSLASRPGREPEPTSSGHRHVPKCHHHRCRPCRGATLTTT